MTGTRRRRSYPAVSLRTAPGQFRELRVLRNISLKAVGRLARVADGDDW